MSDPIAPVPGPASDPRRRRTAVSRSSLSDGQWHRMHPLTPLMRGGLVLLVILGIVISNMRDRLLALLTPVFMPWMRDDIASDATVPDDPGDIGGYDDPIDWVVINEAYLLVLGAIAAVLVVIVLWFYLTWRFHSFRITDDDVEVRSGVLYRTVRRAPLDRIQGVNLTRPMIARLFGMAKLEVVSAGAEGNVKLEYLSTANAETVRADLLRLASGRTLEEQRGDDPVAGKRTLIGSAADSFGRGFTGIVAGEETGDGAVGEAVRVPTGRIVAAQLLSPTVLILVLVAVALIVVSALRPYEGAEWMAFAIFPILIALVAYLWQSILRSLRWSVVPTVDGLRMTFGLLTTVTETLPPGRVHALELVQPILWRPFGWWLVRFTRLGQFQSASDAKQAVTNLLPVGTLADAQRLLPALLPGISAQECSDLIARGTTRADGDGFVTSPRRAWLFHPLSWRRNGVRLTEQLVLLRAGALSRRLALIPTARVQSVAISQGPLTRSLNLANLRLHTVAGPVWTWLYALGRPEAWTAFGEIMVACVRASASDMSHRWAEGRGEHLAAAVFGSAAPDRAPLAVETRIEVPGYPVAGVDGP